MKYFPYDSLTDFQVQSGSGVCMAADSRTDPSLQLHLKVSKSSIKFCGLFVLGTVKAYLFKCESITINMGIQGTASSPDFLSCVYPRKMPSGNASFLAFSMRKQAFTSPTLYIHSCILAKWALLNICTVGFGQCFGKLF